jgi:hypothetical protein
LSRRRGDPDRDAHGVPHQGTPGRGGGEVPRDRPPRQSPRSPGSARRRSERKLKVATKGGVDLCGGSLAEIGTVVGDGSTKRDTLTLDRSRGLEGARLRFHIFLGAGRDTCVCWGMATPTGCASPSSKPPARLSRSSSGAGSKTGHVRRRTPDDSGSRRHRFLVGKPVDPIRFTRAIDIQMITSGGPGSDGLVGGRKRDVLEGEGGNDYLRGGRAPDVLAGGGGTDDCGGPGHRSGRRL